MSSCVSRAGPRDGHFEIGLQGEIDLGCREDLGRALAAFALSNLADLVVDLTAVTFLDSLGIQLLLNMARRAADRSGSVHLVGVQPQIQHVIDMTGVGGVLGQN